MFNLDNDDFIKWIPYYWPFVWGIHRSAVNSPHKCQWRGALMFSLICAWINDWVHTIKCTIVSRWFGMSSHPLWHHCNDNQHSMPWPQWWLVDICQREKPLIKNNYICGGWPARLVLWKKCSLCKWLSAKLVTWLLIRWSNQSLLSHLYIRNYMPPISKNLSMLSADQWYSVKQFHCYVFSLKEGPLIKSHGPIGVKNQMRIKRPC